MDDRNPSLKFMQRTYSRLIIPFFMAIPFVLILCGSALGQQNFFLPDGSSGLEAGFVDPASQSLSSPAAPSHRFWDRENRLLFASVAASNTLDFAVTYSNLQDGGKELNPVTRLFTGNTATLALNFVGETAGVIGASYFFHRTGHHRLERLTPIIDTCISGAAVSYGLTHHR
jgi:hypothetical protein